MKALNRLLCCWM